MNIKIKQLTAAIIAIGFCVVAVTVKAATPPTLPTTIAWDGQHFNGQQYTLPASQTTTVTGVSWGATASILAQISIILNGSAQVTYNQVPSANCSGGLWFAPTANTPVANSQSYFTCDATGSCAPWLLPPVSGNNPVCSFTIQNTSASNAVTITFSNSLDKSNLKQNQHK